MNGKAPFQSLVTGAPIAWRHLVQFISCESCERVSYLLFNQTKYKMVQCAVEGCSSRSDTVSVSAHMENAVHFHRPPKEPHVRKKWMQAINKPDFNKSTRVCSLHFKVENYYSTKLGFKKLVKGTVPELKLTKEKPTDDHSDSSEDDSMSNVQPAEQNSPSHSHQSSLNKPPGIRKTDSVMGSSIIKPGVQKIKVKTALERKLIQQVRRLQESGKEKMEAIHCLLEQNRRLLERNSFLEKALDNSNKSSRKCE